MNNETTNTETRKECEANIAYYRSLLQSLNLNRYHPDCQEEEYKANHAYYNAELKVWKERLEKTNRENGVSNSGFINTVMAWAH